jgi:nitroreductase
MPKTLDTLARRRSVRAYLSRPVEREKLETLIDCARLAPTALNIQPWEFVVVTDETLLKRIAQATDHGRFIAEAAACIVVLSKKTKYYIEDGSAATVNILLAAHSLGLGTCWVAGDKKPYCDAVLKLVGAAGSYKLVSLIPVGYPAEEPNPEKRSLDAVLHWNTL